MNNYRLIGQVGCGAYSTVHKAVDINTGQIVAIKKITTQNMSIKHIISREVNFLHESINHPNIIQLYKCFSQNDITYLVFQYMPMDLISFYKSFRENKKRNLNEDQICLISYQLINALNFLHSKGIMHRDIKPENILIDPDTMTIKLIDFGFAKKISQRNKNGKEDNTNYMVTRWYRAMEIVLGLPYDEKIDVFAAGALILELYRGQQIFRSSSNADHLQWIIDICGVPEWPQAAEKAQKLGINMNPKRSPQLKSLMNGLRPLSVDLISKMLKVSPHQRITIKETFTHPYFSRFKVKNSRFQTNILKIGKSQHGRARDNSLNLEGSKIRSMSTDVQGSTALFTFRRVQNLAQQEEQNNISQFNCNQQDAKHILRTENDSESDYKRKKAYLSVLNKSKTKIPSDYQNKISSDTQPNLTREVRGKQYTNIANPNRPRNRMRSLNQGINVVSLKKLKVQRDINNSSNRHIRGQYRMVSKKMSREKKNTLQQHPTIRLNPRKQNKQKPMFLRVKQKINEGKFKQRGQRAIERSSQNLETAEQYSAKTRRQVATKIPSASSLRFGMNGKYKTLN